jgi:hypothetical protein
MSWISVTRSRLLQLSLIQAVLSRIEIIIYAFSPTRRREWNCGISGGNGNGCINIADWNLCGLCTMKLHVMLPQLYAPHLSVCNTISPFCMVPLRWMNYETKPRFNSALWLPLSECFQVRQMKSAARKSMDRLIIETGLSSGKPVQYF